MSLLLKCYNCRGPNGVPGRDFADADACPGCKLDRADPRFGHMIVARETIHFTDPHPTVNRRGCGVVLCDGRPYPPPTAGDADIHVTGEAAAATCLACLAKLAEREKGKV